MLTQVRDRFEYQDKPEGEGVYKAQLYYSKGGMNYFNYKDEPRGIYFGISVVKIERSNGMVIESFMMFQNKGLKTFVLPLERKSAPRLAKMAALIGPKVAEIVELFKTDQNAAFNRLHEVLHPAGNGVLGIQTA